MPRPTPQATFNGNLDAVRACLGGGGVDPLAKDGRGTSVVSLAFLGFFSNPWLGSESDRVNQMVAKIANFPYRFAADMDDPQRTPQSIDLAIEFTRLTTPSYGTPYTRSRPVPTRSRPFPPVPTYPRPTLDHYPHHIRYHIELDPQCHRAGARRSRRRRGGWA